MAVLTVIGGLPAAYGEQITSPAPPPPPPESPGSSPSPAAVDAPKSDTPEYHVESDTSSPISVRISTPPESGGGIEPGSASPGSSPSPPARGTPKSDTSSPSSLQSSSATPSSTGASDDQQASNEDSSNQSSSADGSDQSSSGDPSSVQTRPASNRSFPLLLGALPVLAIGGLGWFVVRRF